MLPLKMDKGGHEPKNVGSLFKTRSEVILSIGDSPIEPPERKAGWLSP